MLGGMEDPKVGDQPLAELAGLQIGLFSNEDTCVSCFFRYASFCLLWTFSSEWSKCSRRVRTLSGQRLPGIPVLECIF
jgi:hypothetical protein